MNKMVVKVFLDTNIFIAFLLKRDYFSERILNESKKGTIETYTSIHILTEILNIISKNKDLRRISDDFKNIVADYKINIIYDYGTNIISGSFNVNIDSLSYEDLINLKIAEEKKINYFITNDMDLIARKKYKDVKIIPSKIISEIITGDK